MGRTVVTLWACEPKERQTTAESPNVDFVKLVSIRYSRVIVQSNNEIMRNCLLILIDFKSIGNLLLLKTDIFGFVYR